MPARVPHNGLADRLPHQMVAPKYPETEKSNNCDLPHFWLEVCQEGKFRRKTRKRMITMEKRVFSATSGLIPECVILDLES